VKPHGEETETVEEAPASKPKLTMVVILSMLLGILLMVIVVGAFLSHQKGVRQNLDVLSLNDALKEKSVAIEDMRGQIKVLSRNIQILKECSIARSGAADERLRKNTTPAADSTVNSSALPQGASNGSPAVPRRAKKSKADAPDCELVGKSPEEQAATLQRCVSVIDPPSEKLRK
jgi:TolA-binding protein